MINIYSQYLAEKDINILRIIGGWVRWAAVGDSKIKNPVWSELGHPAVVICKIWMRNRQYDSLGSVCYVRIRWRGMIFSNGNCAIGLSSVIDEEPSVRGIVWVKRQP